MKSLCLIILWIHFRSFSGYSVSIFNAECGIWYWKRNCNCLGGEISILYSCCSCYVISNLCPLCYRVKKRRRLTLSWALWKYSLPLPLIPMHWSWRQAVIQPHRRPGLTMVSSRFLRFVHMRIRMLCLEMVQGETLLYTRLTRTIFLFLLHVHTTFWYFCSCQVLYWAVLPTLLSHNL